MKGSFTVLASGLMLVGAFLLVSQVEDPEETARNLERMALGQQLGAVAVLEQVSPIWPSQEPLPEKVAVTVVEEAWDEVKREKERDTTPPEPVRVDGGGTLELRNETGYTVDLGQLPALPQLSGEPVVLIMHTHGSEGYTDPELEGYRTQAEERSVLAVGETIKEGLEEAGIQVIHDKTLCDYPEYTGAYNRSRSVIEKNLAEHPEITLVLDIHRDAVENPDGTQMRMGCTLERGEAAQLMLVVGTDAGGLEHPGWQVNLSLGAILQMRLSEKYPDFMRPLNLRTERFNQDLAPMTLLVEVGASGNTLEEAKVAAEVFAEAISQVLLSLKGQSS